MKLDHENGNYGRIFDANGLEWDHVLRCDTDTGEIVKQVVRDGHLLYNPHVGQILTEKVQTAAPLVFRKFGKDYHWVGGPSYPMRWATPEELKEFAQ